jgi:hypothetical protein
MSKLLSAVLLWAAMVSCALAQDHFTAPGNQTVPGSVGMCLNAAGQAVVCNPTNPGTGVTGSFAGADTTTAAATLAGAAGKTTYVCGFSINGLGATAATTVNVTVGTLIGGNSANFVYIFALGATVQNTPLVQNFSPCIPANAVNTAITVTVPGAAGNTSTNISAWGFQL